MIVFQLTLLAAFLSSLSCFVPEIIRQGASARRSFAIGVKFGDLKFGESPPGEEAQSASFPTFCSAERRDIAAAPPQHTSALTVGYCR